MTYNVALVGDDRDRQVVTGSDSVAIGDELDVQGIRCEVIAHLWRVGEPETLLCRCLGRSRSGGIGAYRDSVRRQNDRS